MSTETAKNTRGGKYLTFSLGREEYGLAILKVREIIGGCMEITAVPRTPEHVRGVINLRGQVIAVIDLRAKFGMERAPRTDATCIIVVDIAHENTRCCTGVIVDRVSEVLNIAGENIEDPPEFGAAGDFVMGLGKVGKSVKILLDIDRILSTQDVTEIQAAGAIVGAAN